MSKESNLIPQENFLGKYQVHQILGHNLSGGRVTYQGLEIDTAREVVVKQFQFANTGSSWNIYSQIESEIEILKQLNHSGIPRYIDSFELDNGFCLVQEYKKARYCNGSYTFEEVKLIARKVLDILIYLQQPNRSIIHRDIKPENILVGENMEVFLVDFGFAKNNDRFQGKSSVVKGTFGFMPPEQMIGKKLDFSADLYSLGVTLFCLLTRTTSEDVGELFDDRLVLNYKKLPSNLDPNFKIWLEKITQVERKKRFPNAQLASTSLSNLHLGLETSKITKSKNIILLKQTIYSLLDRLIISLDNIIYSEFIEKASKAIMTALICGIPLVILGNLVNASTYFVSNLNNSVLSYEQGNKAYSVKDYTAALAQYDTTISQLTNESGKLKIPDFLVIDDLFEDLLWRTLFKQGNSYYHLGRYSEAIESYDLALELNPNNARFYYNRGIARFSANQLEQALADFNKAIEIKPDYTSAIKNRDIILSERFYE